MINRLPFLSTGFGANVMDSTGVIYKRVLNFNEVYPEGNFLFCGTDAVITIRNNKPALNPIIVPNKIFTDCSGVSFIRAHEKTETEVAEKAFIAGCGYIIARKQPDKSFIAEAFMNGQQVDFPAVLTNEMGVSYTFVDYAKYGEVCKATYGYCTAKKVEGVYLVKAKVGASIEAVLNGVSEHETYLEEDEVMVQNMYHGESYKMTVVNLKENYFYETSTPEGIEVWQPKGIVQEWTFTNENIFGVLWGGFEFLAKAAINLNKAYGCNFEVFHGNDIAKGSHQKLQMFLPVHTVDLPREETQEETEGHGQLQEGIPKGTFVELPFPSNNPMLLN